MPKKFRIPIILIVFKRFDLAIKVFERIATVKPEKLIVIADGPRDERDFSACEKARSIIDFVNWNCDLKTNFSDVNLGCRRRISTGLDWAFEAVDQAIILEEDCLPDFSFFEYCEMLLDYYKDDNRIMAISGNSFQSDSDASQYSYYFSRYNHCWGWATWKRAWKMYDVNMKNWPQVNNLNLLSNILDSKREIRYWSKVFNLTYENKIDTWDYQWTFACWMQNALTVLPSQNLVSNIGFTADATHTSDESSFLSCMPVYPMAFPLRHPPYIIRNKIADYQTEKMMFSLTLMKRAQLKLKNLLNIK